MRLAESARRRSESQSRDVTERSRKGAQKGTQSAASVDVRGRGDHLHPAAAGEEPRGEAREDVTLPGRDASQQIEIVLGERHQRDAAVAGRCDDRVRVLLEELERGGEACRRGRHVAAGNDDTSSESGGPSRGVLQALTERPSPLLEEENLGSEKKSLPGDAVLGRRRDDEPRAADSGSVAPALRKSPEELRPRRGVEPFFERLAARLPGEEKEEPGSHLAHLTVGRRETDGRTMRACIRKQPGPGGWFPPTPR
jgi:hypothetical protein